MSEIRKEMPVKIQVTDGHVYKIKEHALTDKKASTRYGDVAILGIRADAESAKEIYAFMVRFKGGYTCLMSRSEFRLIE